MFINIYVHEPISTSLYKQHMYMCVYYVCAGVEVCVCVCMYVCTYMYMCVYMCVYICVYICMYI